MDIQQAKMNKLFLVELRYIKSPPVEDTVYARDRGHALRIACMNAEAKGWPKFANSHQITEMPL